MDMKSYLILRRLFACMPETIIRFAEHNIEKKLCKKFYSKTVFDKTVISMVDDRAGTKGGLTDRLRGVLAIYDICKRHGIAFKLLFNYPFDIRHFFVPNGYNWSVDETEIIYDNTSLPLIYRALTPPIC